MYNKEIETIKKMLEEHFPTEAMYGSRSSLWLAGLNAGLVNVEEVSKARVYYGKLWNYVGD